MIVSLAQCTKACCGGKAAGLQTLLAARLPVPAGYCLPLATYREAIPSILPPRETALEQVEKQCDALYAEIERWQPTTQLLHSLERHAAELGWPLAVRSSATCEDQQPASSAGAFQSVLNVDSLEQLLAALRTCWRSLWQLEAWAVLRSAGRSPHDEAMAVIIQRQVSGPWAGLALSRAPHQQDLLYVEAVPYSAEALAAGSCDPYVQMLPRDNPVPSNLPLPASILEQVSRQTLAAEHALRTPVEVEWICDHTGHVWLLQARPQPQLATPPSYTAVHASADDNTIWRWDREHNPDPLSPAHASLIDWLNRHLPGPPRLAVLGGFLYEAHEPSTTTSQSESLVQGRQQLERILDQATTACETPAPALERLERALQQFTCFIASYQTLLDPPRRHARAALRTFCATQLAVADDVLAELTIGHPNDSLIRNQTLYELAQAGDSVEEFIQRYGSLVPCWDVAEPTLAEVPHTLDGTLAAMRHCDTAPIARWTRRLQQADSLARRLAQQLPHELAQRFHSLVADARRARASCEDDDLLFARALWLVRRTLLEAGDVLVAQGGLADRDQIFGLGLGAILRSLNDDSEAERLAREASTGLAGWQRLRGRIPPTEVQGTKCRWSPLPHGAILKGLGNGGIAHGAVKVIRTGRELLGADLLDTVLVSPTLIPALALALPQIRALVTDHGGLLSHAACLAREMDIPAVVGTKTATHILRDGDEVWVDGLRGRVIRVKFMVR